MISHFFQKFQLSLKEELSKQKLSSREILLVAVSKYQSAEAMRALYQEGQRDFAESRLQEALLKMGELSRLEIRWHFIGRIQSNKASKVVECFDCLHSVDSVKLAKKLDRCCANQNKNLDVFLQVNLGEETQKQGFSKKELFRDFEVLKTLPRLTLKGLMVLPPRSACEGELEAVRTRSFFRELRAFQEELNQRFYVGHAGEEGMSCLSMGMSQDWRLALAEGSTHLRVGRALFSES